MKQPPLLRIEPIAGYAPTIGRLVGMLIYARYTTVAAVEGLSVAQLDHVQDALDHYLEELSATRRVTLEMFAARDDGWLEPAVAAAPKLNVHWAWFHVMEDEINHQGQIRWLRMRLPRSPA